MKEFNAPWSTSLHVLSWGATAFLLGLSGMAAGGFGDGQTGRVDGWIAAALPALLAVCALFTVRGYTLAPGRLLIRRLLWQTRLDLADLQSASADLDAFRGALRTCGNGGLFSFTGFYWSRHLGAFRAYVTHPGRCVVLRFPRRTVVLSPERPEEFARLVK